MNRLGSFKNNKSNQGFAALIFVTVLSMLSFGTVFGLASNIGRRAEVQNLQNDFELKRRKHESCAQEAIIKALSQGMRDKREILTDNAACKSCWTPETLDTGILTIHTSHNQKNLDSELTLDLKEGEWKNKPFENNPKENCF